jgi:hypothetical protein
MKDNDLGIILLENAGCRRDVNNRVEGLGREKLTAGGEFDVEEKNVSTQKNNREKEGSSV